MRKNLTGLLSAALVLASCAERPSLVDPAGFDGEVDGREVGLYTIANGRLAMQFTNYGGRVVSLFVPDRNGDGRIARRIRRHIQKYRQDSRAPPQGASLCTERTVSFPKTTKFRKPRHPRTKRTLRKKEL